MHGFQTVLRYTMETLVDILHIANYLQGNRHLRKVLEVVGVMIGFEENFIQKLPVPSVTTIRRGRFMFDVAMMLLWVDCFSNLIESENFAVFGWQGLVVERVHCDDDSTDDRFF